VTAPEAQAAAITQARFALDQMIALVRDELAAGMTEAEVISDLTCESLKQPTKAISMAVMAVVELAKRGPS
jgi:hypothetical protein